MNGYILISRKIVESEIWSKPPLYLKVWVWLLCKAQFQDYKNLKRGQVRTSIKEIQEACAHYSGYRKEVPTLRQIRTILEWLRNPRGCNNGCNCGSNDGSNMIETMGVTHGVVITICNFNDYQDPKFYGSNNGSNTDVNTGVVTENLRSSEQCQDKENTDKNTKNTKTDIKKDTTNVVSKESPLGEFQNVYLTEEELEKLKERFPYDWKERIENLSQYMKSKGKRYKSHYATILTWARKDEKGKGEQGDAGKQTGNPKPMGTVI